MAIKRKRRKQSGIIYFAVNNRVDDMVKIGKTIESAEKRLEYANKTTRYNISFCSHAVCCPNSFITCFLGISRVFIRHVSVHL